MRRGFTLVELTVVLIVIGLVVGAVVVGRDLLHGARLRAQVSQLEQFDGALGAFRAKYAGLPGDLSAGHAAALGFVVRSGEPGHGDGNGLLDACEPWAPFTVIPPLGCETAIFWADLANAGLVPGMFPAAEDDYINVAGIEDSFGYFPKAAIAGDWGVVIVPVRCASTGHSYRLMRVHAFSGGSASFGRSLYARDAHWLDSKIDDGRPRTGRMQERSISFSSDGYFCSTAPTVSCVAGNDYNLAAPPLPGACSPQIRMGGT